MLKEEWELLRDFIESVEIYPEKLDNGCNERSAWKKIMCL